MIDEDEQIRREMAAIEAFDPSQPARKIVFRWPDAGGVLHDHPFFQETLGHFATIELGLILKKIIRDVMAGKYGIDLKELIRDRKKLSLAQAEVLHSHGDGAIDHSHSISFGRMQNAELVLAAVDHEIEVGVTSKAKSFRETALNKLVDHHSHVEVDFGAVYEQFQPLIEAFMQILDETPEIEQEIMALSLGVRRRDREEFKERISEAPHVGGLTNSQAVDIIKVFIRQNAEEIRRFLGEELREIGEVFMEAIEEIMPRQESSTSSNGTTPSNTSSASIQA